MDLGYSRLFVGLFMPLKTVCGHDLRSGVWQLAASKIDIFLEIFVTRNILPSTAVDPNIQIH